MNLGHFLLLRQKLRIYVIICLIFFSYFKTKKRKTVVAGIRCAALPFLYRWYGNCFTSRYEAFSPPQKKPGKFLFPGYGVL